MSELDRYNVSEIIKVYSGKPQSTCNLCTLKVHYNQEELINHYISEHGYKIVYIGTESTVHEKKQLSHETVTILGK